MRDDGRVYSTGNTKKHVCFERGTFRNGWLKFEVGEKSRVYFETEETLRKGSQRGSSTTETEDVLGSRNGGGGRPGTRERWTVVVVTTLSRQRDGVTQIGNGGEARFRTVYHPGVSR